MHHENHRSDFDTAIHCDRSALTKEERLSRARAVLEQWNVSRGAEIEPIDDPEHRESARQRGPLADRVRSGEMDRAAP